MFKDKYTIFDPVEKKLLGNASYEQFFYPCIEYAKTGNTDLTITKLEVIDS
jgi:hypothetical protein